ncbi:MAG: 50S ribosome-binding GTPase [Syntrophobacteraceae bacterium]|jgi:GTPase Era involved in 16S rRNA processing|nr:50S ribosome-binding GTPase [Syntrophobacteraceae bacterium]
MNRSLEAFRSDLRQVTEMLDRGGAPALAGEDVTALRLSASVLSRKLDELTGSTLTVGLLGGTGVGKSSLMNGLAGAEIASASHRRPHTDRVLVYRHGTSVLPSSLLHTHVPWEEHVHDADAVRQIILCDLPDFDSLVGLHLQHVKDFLENLDLLVWVVSPEKYADERFHSFLAEAPKAAENFVFVMNKVDQFFGGSGLEVGYQMLARVTQTFHRRLLERGMEHPIIYGVSALDALRGAEAGAWNQFNAFRHHVFHERDTKEVTAIKTANLDQELEALLAAMDEKALQAGKLRRVLEELASGFSRDRADWVRTGRDVLGDWIETDVRSHVRRMLMERSELVGVGSILQKLVQRLDAEGATGAAGVSLARQLNRDGILGRLTDQWSRMENRVVHRALQEGVPGALLGPVQEVFDRDERWNEWTRSLRSLLDLSLANVSLFSSRRFRWLQVGAYSLLTAMLILGIGLHGLGDLAPGESGWKAALTWVVGSIRMLFSAEGLAALTSYCVLLLLLSLRFHVSRKKRLQRQEQNIIEALKSDLGRIWDVEFDAVINRLLEHCKELDREVEEISSLRQRRGRE